jgi:MoaA/NifB/PqqE/SkfB family radical SAM enzyme
MASFFRAYGPAAIHVILCNYGEPLVHPDTPKFIRMAKRYLMHTMISTNLALPRFDAEAYVASGLDHMVLSIDGATQAVYERFRKKGDIHLVYENVRKLLAARCRAGKRTPTIAWRFLAFEHNVHEIPAAIERARELGVDQFSADPAWDVSWDDPGIRPADMEPVVVDFRDDTYDALAGNWNPFPEDLDADAIEREFEQSWAAKVRDGVACLASGAGASCEWLYKSITMDAGGRILPCCCSPTPSRDLHFAQFDEGDAANAYNSEKHRMSRLFFADPVRYRAERESGRLERDPHCVHCEWDKTGDPNAAQIRNYFQVAAGDLIDARTLDLLASW